jgi:hypothetical protein
MHTRNPYRPSSRRFLVAEHYFNGDSQAWAYRHLAPKLGKTINFSRNVHGTRIPNPLHVQQEQLRRTIKTTYRLLAQDEANRTARNDGFEDRKDDEGRRARDAAMAQAEQMFEQAQQQTSEEAEREAQEAFIEQAQQQARDFETEQDDDRDESGGEQDDDRDEATQEDSISAHAEQVISEGFGLVSDAEQLFYWIRDIWRPLVESKNSTGAAMDSVGMRPIINGAKMLRAGIPVDAIKHALTMDYPDEIRRDLGVHEVDILKLKPTPQEGIGWDAAKARGATYEVPEHEALDYCVALARAGVPIYLYGGKGTGKTELSKQIVSRLCAEGFYGDEADPELLFGSVSMSPGTSPSAFFGRPTLDGRVIPSQFSRIIAGGGGFLFDEIDNGEPDLLTLLNAAMANGFFNNDATGERVRISMRMVWIAAGNTIGKGSEGGYLRRPLDEATQDRWAAGRCRIDLDLDLEANLFWRALA